MTPEESSIFFTLLSGTASEPKRRSIDFLADPDAGDWDEGITTNTYLVGDYICGDLQEHARGCNLPIAECRLCRLCELEIKRRWPDLWLSKWPGAAAGPETHEFTALEFEVILGMCRGLPKQYIAEQCGLTEGIVHTIMRSIFDKAWLMGRGDFFGFVRDALNGELRRRGSPVNHTLQWVLEQATSESFEAIKENAISFAEGYAADHRKELIGVKLWLANVLAIVDPRGELDGFANLPDRIRESGKKLTDAEASEV